MKKIIIFLSLLLFFSYPLSSSAHFHTADGIIQGLIHVDPDDNPIAGAKSNVHIDVTDSKNEFKTLNCDCRVEIYENERLIDSIEKISESAIYDIVFVTEFPNKGVYQVILDAKPKSDVNFEPFKLAFNVRVDREIEGLDKIIHNLSEYRGQILFVIVALVFGLFIILKRIY